MRHLFADGGYAGNELTEPLTDLGLWAIRVNKRGDRPEGFEVLPRRWLIEHTFAWLGRCRRLAWDCQIETVRQEFDHN